MITIGITGGFATGKTTVVKMFRELGAKVVDADRIARSITKPKTLVWKSIVDYFGKEVLKKNGYINRNKLAKIIFSNKTKRYKLNSFLHPHIISEIKRIINTAAKGSKTKVLVVDAPLLFESGINKLFDKIIVVLCRYDIQQKRALMRKNLSLKQINKRIKSQWPLNRKIKKADFIINNNKNFIKTKREVNGVWKELVK